MELHLKIIGLLSLLLAMMHGVFPFYFKWKTELKDLSLINRQMMLVHTFFIALIVFLTGFFCLFSTKELIQSKTGNQFLWGLSLFWGIRLLAQFFIYSPELWKGKKLETIVHVCFSLLWLYFTVALFIIAREGMKMNEINL